MTEATTSLSTNATEQEGSELRYLLSAYLFGSLSEEGRLEVERQLENSEASRDELEELRETLSMLTDALDPDAAPVDRYCFEEKRMERVLATSRSKSPLRLLTRPPLVSAAAAILIFIGIAIPLVLSRIQSSAPQDGLVRFSSGSDYELADDSEGLAMDENRMFLRAEKSAEHSKPANPVPRKPRELVPQTISKKVLPPPPGSTSRSRQPQQQRDRPKVLLDPSDPASPPALTGASASAAEELSVGDTSVIDVIGIGGGAAGAYGKRFGKGRAAAAGKKEGAQKDSSPNQRSRLNRSASSSKESQTEISPEAGAEGEPEGVELSESPEKDAEDARVIHNQGKELKKAQRRQQPMEKRRITTQNGKSRSADNSSSAGLRSELKKLDSLEQAVKKNKVAKFSAEPALAEEASTERPLLRQLSQSSRKAPRGDLRQRDTWAYNLNIAQTKNGYSSLGKGTRRSQQQGSGQQAQLSAGGPVEINEKALNSYAWYREMDPNLSYEQFSGRALIVPAPALGDEGLGEKGFRNKYGVNPFVATNRDHLSTFGMDVDNASWGRTVETIRDRGLPPPETVRVEEFVNNFPDPRPGNPGSVFTVYTEGGPSPFGDHDLELIQLTVKSRELARGERRDANLTFAIDTSGSMADNGKLQLLKSSIRTLVSNLEPNDRVAIVAFSTNAYVVLPHTSVRQKSEIEAAIASLHANGGTNVEAGIDLAYRLAAESSNRRAANRVILCSDGVANLGARGPEAVLQRIRRYARDNLVALFTYAFGTGGRQAVRGDRMLQRLADEGDGRYQYVDSASTSRSIFSLPDQLQILASDAKIQVDFNPDVVSHYRLLGYEKRDIADKDFRNDKVDAGEVGPGATVTALYEIKRSRPVGSLGRIRLRYLDTLSGRVEETDFDLPPGILAEKLTNTTERFRLIASVAEFAELLRGSYYARNGSYGAILEVMSRFSPAARNRLDFAEIYRIVGKAQGLCAVRTLQNIKE